MPRSGGGKGGGAGCVCVLRGRERRRRRKRRRLVGMAFTEPLHGMCDPRLKARLLNSVIAAHLPDAEHPSKSPARLSLAVSIVRRHHLLSEPRISSSAAVGLLTSSASKALDPLKAAVDDWMMRISNLVSSTSPESCWAGVCLVGITCQECSRQRFLESFPSWFQKLHVHLKPTDPLFIRGATCASLTDLLTRLGGLIEFAGIRRKGTAVSGKLIQPILQLLDEEGSKSLWNDAVDLLCVVLKYFPSSVKQHYSQVDSLLVAKIMGADCNSSFSQKFACCLAMLPRAHGDAATWSSLIHRVLIAINSYLDSPFSGMEDAGVAKEIAASLVPRGQESPWALDGLSMAANTSTEGSHEFWQLVVPGIYSLLQCCCLLLVNPYPVQVPVPLGGLLALVTRILSVDGCPHKAVLPFGVTVSSIRQASLCSELPALHSCALDLLYAIICGVRSKLLPCAATIVCLIMEYFRHCKLLDLRIKLYDICKCLLISMGVGMASAIASTIIDNALSDLKCISSLSAPYNVRNSSINPSLRVTAPSGWNHTVNPRKHKDMDIIQDDFTIPSGTSALGIDMTHITSPLSIHLAALQAIEAFLTVGGALCSDQVRAEVDLVVANVALSISSWTVTPNLRHNDGVSSTRQMPSVCSSGDFQLAAYKAFLASLLSPCGHRPRFLSQGLAVFCKGKHAVGTEVAEFCAHALLALEPLIHPRCLPSINTQATFFSGRVSASDTLVDNTQHCGVPLTVATSLPTVSGPSANLGYETALIPPVLKSSLSGMHLEVEGDPYIHEDIESWIVDYGDDQNMLSETNVATIENMVNERFDGGIPALDGTQSVHLKCHGEDGIVSSMQSASIDEEGLIMHMVVDTFMNTREEVGGVTPATNSMSVQKSTASGVSVKEGNIEVPLKEADIPAAVSVYTQSPVDSSAQIPEGQKQSIGDLFPGPVNNMQLPDSTSIEKAGDMDICGVKVDQGHAAQTVIIPAVPAVLDHTLSEGGMHRGSESDSDAIPDIVDGDPDTE